MPFFESTRETRNPMGIRLARPASVAVFLTLAVLIAFDTAGDIRHVAMLLAAVLTAGYLALNIGANDAANNIGTAVGSGALTLTAALLLAAAASWPAPSWPAIRSAPGCGKGCFRPTPSVTARYWPGC